MDFTHVELGVQFSWECQCRVAMGAVARCASCRWAALIAAEQAYWRQKRDELTLRIFEDGMK